MCVTHMIVCKCVLHQEKRREGEEKEREGKGRGEGEKEEEIYNYYYTPIGSCACQMDGNRVIGQSASPHPLE